MLPVLCLIYKTTVIVIYTQVSSFCINLLSCTITGVSYARSISYIEDNSDCDVYTSKFIL